MLHRMELLVILVLFGALAVLAPRFGRDSRETIQSNEEKLAWNGYRWGRSVAPISRQRRVRRRVARALYTLAAWLNPELKAAKA
jgi:hypothetical protein